MNDAPEDAKENAGFQASTLREYFITIVVCTTFALFVTTYIVHPMTVPTPSMYPTIQVGDRLLIDKFSFRNWFSPGGGLAARRPIRRGDIVVFKFPEDPTILYVKRAIGLPGETIEVRGPTVFINGQALEEGYKFFESRPDLGFENGFHGRSRHGPIEIGPDEYFVMGDNRENSADSRVFGILRKDHIVGRPMVVFWSYEDDPDAHQKSSPLELLKLYGQRILYFFSRTRWSRFGHLVR